MSKASECDSNPGGIVKTRPDDPNEKIIPLSGTCIPHDVLVELIQFQVNNWWGDVRIEFKDGKISRVQSNRVKVIEGVG